MPSSAVGGDRRRGDGRRRQLQRLAHGGHRLRCRRATSDAADRGEHADRGGAARPHAGRCAARPAAPASRRRRMRHPRRRGVGDRAVRATGQRAVMSSPSATAAVTPATADGTQSSGPASARVIAASDADAAEREHHDREPERRPPQLEQTGRRGDERRARSPMPTSRAILSFVPNSAIAASFAHGGARSMSAEPITANGLAPGATSAAVSSPSPAPSTAAATPAPAAASRVAPSSRAPRARAYVRRIGAGASRGGITRLSQPARRPAPRNMRATRPRLGSSHG